MNPAAPIALDSGSALNSELSIAHYASQPIASDSIYFSDFGQFDTRVEIPLNLTTLPAFRDWIDSDAAPERGRFDDLNGRIEVDRSPEDLFTQSALKTRLSATLE